MVRFQLWRRTMRTRIFFIAIVVATLAQAQERPAAAQPDLAAQVRQLQNAQRADVFAIAEAQKAADDVLWHLKLGDVADVDKVAIASSKPIRMSNSTGQGAGNPFIIYCYTFVPKN